MIPSTDAAHPQSSVRPSDLMGQRGWLSLGLIALEWAVVVGLAALGELIPRPWSIPAYGLIAFLIGGRMISLAEVIGHDSVHHNLFQNRGLHRRLDFLWFLPLFDTWDAYRENHERHHAYLLSPRDPAYQDYERWGLLRPNVNWFYVWFIRPFLFFDTVYMLRSIVAGLWTDAAYRRRILAFWVPVTAAFAWFGALDLLFWYWLLPLFWAYPAILFWSETGEHFRTPVGDSRNTFGLLEYCMISPHYDRYHAVHHRYPRIPWFRLKQATELLAGPGDASKSTGFFDLYRQMRDESLPRIAKRTSRAA